MISNTKRIYLVAEEVVATSVQRLFKQVYPNLQVIGQQDLQSENLIANIIRSRADVVVVQHRPGDLTSLDTVRQLKNADNQIRTLMLLFDESDFWTAIETKADGYAIWPTPFLTNAVDVIANGGVWLGPLVAEYLLRGEGYAPIQMAARSLVTPPAEFNILSAREKQVLNLLLGGMTNQQIADSLELSVGTVKVHVRHILNKLKLEHRGEAIAKLSKLRLTV